MNEKEVGLEEIQKEWLRRAKLLLVMVGKRWRLYDAACPIHSSVTDDEEEKAKLIAQLAEVQKEIDECCREMMAFEGKNAIGVTQILPPAACQKCQPLYICGVLLTLSRCNESLRKSLKSISEIVEISSGRNPSAFFLLCQFRTGGLLVPHLHIDHEQPNLDTQVVVFKDTSFCAVMNLVASPEEKAKAILWEPFSRRRF